MHLQLSNNESQVYQRQPNGVSSEEVTPVVRHGRRINEEGYAAMNNLLDSHLDLLKQELEKHKRAPSFGNNQEQTVPMLSAQLDPLASSRAAEAINPIISVRTSI